MNRNIKSDIEGKIHYRNRIVFTIKFLPVAFFLLLMHGCITPFDADINENQEMISIDGSIIKGEILQSVTVSRSSSLEYQPMDPVTGCTVWVEDTNDNFFLFYEAGDGDYVASIPDEYLVAGNAFRLSVITPDGNTYESDYEPMLQGSEVDSLYYGVEEHLDNIVGNIKQGVQFYVDIEAPDTISRYFRWDMEETYEIHSIAPISYIIGGPEKYPKNSREFYTCWKSADIRDLFISNTVNLTVNEKKRIPLNFVSTGSDRLRIKYSLLVNQYSVTEGAFDYWEKNRSETHDGGGLYTRQPGNPVTNIHNVHDSTEVVLGYFWCSQKTSKRIFVPKIDSLDVAFNCELVPYVPLFHDDGPYPRYIYIDIITGIKMTGPNFCFNCTFRDATTEKPDFWE